MSQTAPSTPLEPGQRPVALVTGAARRVGRAIAVELARAGHDVAIHCRASLQEADRLADELRAMGAGATVFQADLADEAATQALVPAVLARLGRLDAVVNNASSFEPDDVGSFRYGALVSQMQANVAPAIVLARQLHRHCQAEGRTGCVVNLLDQKLWNPNPDYLSYTLSKAALESATQVLAMALAPVLRVCGVAPGLTLLSGDMTEAEFAHAHRLTPLHRASSPQDVARAVRFLLESPAITGTTVLVDGGQHLLGQPRDVMFLARQALGSTP